MKLNRKTLFFYGLVDLPISMSLFPVAVFIPKFYASDMAVPLSVVGAILFFVRWTDVVTDPLMGYISDHTSKSLRTAETLDRTFHADHDGRRL